MSSLAMAVKSARTYAYSTGVRMGNNCRIFPGAIIGSIPQDLKFEGELSTLEIGNNVIIREYCTINRGTKANYKTVIGDYCMVMAYVHIAHDCVIGDHVILANSVNLAGPHCNWCKISVRWIDSGASVCTNWIACHGWWRFFGTERCSPIRESSS